MQEHTVNILEKNYFHPLHTSIHPPEKFNNPFYYEPHPLCLLASKELQELIPHLPLDDEGKMFGILVGNYQGQLGYLAAYSGQIAPIREMRKNTKIKETENSILNFFVPAVFDYLQPEGYFKIHENEISRINKDIHNLSTASCLLELKDRYTSLQAESALFIKEKTIAAQKAKIRRDIYRQKGEITPEEQEAMIKESQFLKAEVHRAKIKYTKPLTELQQQINTKLKEITKLKKERKEKSDMLQHWLFSQFKMANAKGKYKNLLAIFKDTAAIIPPSGSGECCEPKLLQYALTHNIQPLCIAMFWWGKSPKTDIRHHLHYYPACNGKCKPILQWMLQGIDVEKNPLEINEHQTLQVIYDDPHLAVINKPEGMLSVPGKNHRESVLSITQQKYPNIEGPIIVHRLDMATSGLLVIAKDTDTYINLQKQFANHTVRKRYVALLEHDIEPGCGTISLPLIPDIMDRPRQNVDWEKGKKAITQYKTIGKRRILLYPQTGRTHQLRVHCAHPEGLNNPILGDMLYGERADRLYLHAEYLEFTHPITGERVHFSITPSF
ncbi:MAG TPA: RNA pseudouridine synthase [Prevotella sp.]|nr:RNA pseudouridine synthase [Prevotella sp.]